MNFVDYKKYIIGDVWKLKRDTFMKLYGKECFICKTSQNLVCHHLHYKTLSNEKKIDLLAVCWTCHSKIHDNKLKGELSQWNFDNTKDGRTLWE